MALRPGFHRRGLVHQAVAEVKRCIHELLGVDEWFALNVLIARAHVSEGLAVRHV